MCNIITNNSFLKPDDTPNLSKVVTVNVVTFSHGSTNQDHVPSVHCAGGHNQSDVQHAKLQNATHKE